MNGLVDGAIRCVCERHISADGVGISVAERRLQANIDNLNSPRLNAYASALVSDRQGELLSTDRTILGHIETVLSGHHSARHDD